MDGKPLVQWPLGSDPSSRSEFGFVDYAGYAETLAQSSADTCRDNVVEVEACSISGTDIQVESIQSHQDLENHLLRRKSIARGELQKPADVRLDVTNIYVLSQINSRTPLEISLDALKLLLHHLQAFPEIVNIITSFSRDDRPHNEARCGFYTQTSEETNGSPVFETCYLLKHVEKNGRQGRSNPWSVRQIAFYQKFNIGSSQSRCILIQPSLAIQRRLQEELDQNKNKSDIGGQWINLHLLFIGTLNLNWHSYVRFLENMVATIQDSIRFTKIGVKQIGEATFVDLQSLHTYTDLLLRASHVLTCNIEVLGSLSREASKRRHWMEAKCIPQPSNAFEEILQSAIREQTFLRNHSNLVRDRAEHIASVLRDAIALRDNNVMKTLSRTAVIEAELMRTLTEKTIREARSVKTITLVTLVYLPASFTSTFLGMNYIHVTSSPGSSLTLRVDKNLWFYLAITAPLMLVTLLSWYWWELRTRRRMKKVAASVAMATGGDIALKNEYSNV